jgi:Gtr1/RagA G protein conserved region
MLPCGRRVMHARLSDVLLNKQSAFSFGPRLILHSENFRHIQQRVIDELLDTEPEYEQMPVNFHLTSVYDHSVREAFSRVLHKLIDSLPYLEDLLNVFCTVCTLVPCFRLFDCLMWCYAELAGIQGIPL